MGLTGVAGVVGLQGLFGGGGGGRGIIGFIGFMGCTGLMWCRTWGFGVLVVEEGLPDSEQRSRLRVCRV